MHLYVFLGLQCYVEQWHMDHRSHQGRDQGVNSQASHPVCPDSIPDHVHDKFPRFSLSPLIFKYFLNVLFN
jgi:hypothetical protein